MSSASSALIRPVRCSCSPQRAIAEYAGSLHLSLTPDGGFHLVKFPRLLSSFAWGCGTPAVRDDGASHLTAPSGIPKLPCQQEFPSHVAPTPASGWLLPWGAQTEELAVRHHPANQPRPLRVPLARLQQAFPPSAPSLFCLSFLSPNRELKSYAWASIVISIGSSAPCLVAGAYICCHSNACYVHACPERRPHGFRYSRVKN